YLNANSNQVQATVISGPDQNSAQIRITANQQGTAGNGIPFSWSESSVFPGQFPPAYNLSPGSGSLAGGIDPTTIYDKGTVTLTTSNGATATACYGRSADCEPPPSGCATGDSTPAQLACVLAFRLNASSAVTATAIGAPIRVTDRTAGESGNGVTVASNPQSTQTQFTFSPPSFCEPDPPGCNTTLAGGLNAGDLSNSPYVTTYQYDALGNLRCVHQKGTDTAADIACTGTTPPAVPAAWRQRFFTYDSLSPLMTATNPESSKVTYNYDADGELL